jgi:two-component system phosphate regulon sensor histidine kinase PhoR
LSIGKWVSLGIAVICALLVGALMWFVSTWQPWLGAGLGMKVVLATAVTVGVVVALVQWFWLSHLDLQDQAAQAYIRAAGRSDGQPPRCDPRLARLPLLRVFEQSFGQLTQRIDALVNHRRELRIEARVAESELRHTEAVIHAITDAVIVTDAFNEIVLANQAAANLLQFDLEASLRLPMDKVIRDAALAKLIKDTRQFASPGEARHVEHKIGGPDGGATYDVTLVCLSPDEAADRAGPEARGVVAVLRDVTREREVAEMKNQIVSNVSHELRTPLSSIKAYMEMLIDGEAEDEQIRTEFYNVIQSETNRLSRLIDNILNMSSIESGVVAFQPQRMILNDLLREVIEVIRPHAAAKQIELIEQPADIAAQVMADHDMIYQVLVNLASNAIKYTPSGGTVTVAVRIDVNRRHVTVAVSDTGIGIAQDDLPHLFDKFYRVDAHKDIAPGTGLGLSLVRHIVEVVHGGQIGVTSQVSAGSTFSFSLPVAAGKASSQVRSSNGSSANATG